MNLPDGTLLRSEDVMDPPKQGRKIVICGDTSDARTYVGHVLFWVGVGVWSV